jgi:hypothetical protein
VGGRAPGPRAVTGGRGPEDPGRRVVASPLKAKDGCSSEDHLGISLADFGLICSPASARKGFISGGWVMGPLNGLVSRWPRPGHCRPSYVKFTRLGRGDSDTRENWGQSE